LNKEISKAILREEILFRNQPSKFGILAVSKHPDGLSMETVEKEKKP
jgi:hypothetical protein